MTAFTNPAITAQARAVAEAEQALQRASPALSSAETYLATIRDRIAELGTQRADIAARRSRGDHEPDDAGRLALIAVDIEGLEGMVPDADGRIAAARRPVEAATHAVDHARAKLAQAEAAALEAALIEHARHLDMLMVDTLTRLNQAEAQLSHHRPTWGPSANLIAALRRRQAALGTL